MNLYNFFNSIIELKSEILMLKEDKNIITKIFYIVDKIKYNKLLDRLIDYLDQYKKSSISFEFLWNFAKNFAFDFTNDSNLKIKLTDSFNIIIMTMIIDNRTIEITLIDNTNTNNIKIKDEVKYKNKSVEVKKEFRDYIMVSADKHYINELNKVIIEEIIKFIDNNCFL